MVGTFYPSLVGIGSFFTEPGLDGSGKNKKNLIFPTGLEVHFEDIF